MKIVITCSSATTQTSPRLIWNMLTHPTCTNYIRCSPLKYFGRYFSPQDFNQLKNQSFKANSWSHSGRKQHLLTVTSHFYFPLGVHGSSRCFLTLFCFERTQKWEFLSSHTLPKLAGRWASCGGKNEEVTPGHKTCKAQSCIHPAPEKILLNSDFFSCFPKLDRDLELKSPTWIETQLFGAVVSSRNTVVSESHWKHKPFFSLFFFLFL